MSRPGAAQSRMTSPVEWCSCGEQHHPGSTYYVSVMDGTPDRTRLVAGPFSTHAEAKAWVNPAQGLVLAKYNPHGRAHFYAYGTVAMRPGYTVPGILNAKLGLPDGEVTP
jgi:hypothetical protein